MIWVYKDYEIKTKIVYTAMNVTKSEVFIKYNMGSVIQFWGMHLW